MDIEAAIYAKLAATSGVTDLLGDPPRIYPGQAPQSSTLPVLIYHQAHRKQLMTLTGPINLNAYLMRLDAFADTYAEAKAVYNATRSALNGFKGEITVDAETIDVQGIFEETGDEESLQPIHAEEDGTYRAGLDLAIHYG